MLVPSHNSDPVAGESLTAKPPNVEATPLTAIILSPIFSVFELTVVVVPFTVKSPDRVRPVNVGESPVPTPSDVLAVAPVSNTKLEPSPTIIPPSVTANPATSASCASYA